MRTPTAPFSMKSWNFHSQLPVKVGVPLIVMSVCFFRHHLILSDRHQFKNKGKHSELSGGLEPGKRCANCQMLFIWLWSVTKIKKEMEGGKGKTLPCLPSTELSVGLTFCCWWTSLSRAHWGVSALTASQAKSLYAVDCGASLLGSGVQRLPGLAGKYFPTVQPAVGSLWHFQQLICFIRDEKLP